eukprot:GHVP01019576.1.p2 GENE.GHVP01019576.1~~GHVP01019576.1.p2  ORF type:complete len:136 (-),score=14.02 GHVP01019576.1:197-604(-)
MLTPQTVELEMERQLTCQNKLHLPVFELEWIALWKGVAKFLATMKKFGMNTIQVPPDNTVVVDAFAKNYTPISPTSDYYLDKIPNFLAKESVNYSVQYIPSNSNKADSYSRDTGSFIMSKWISWRESLERRKLES